MKNDFLTKNIDLKIKDFDESKRLVAFYIVKFGSVDLHGDLFIQESIFFKETNLKHFKNHDVNMPVGVVQEVSFDDFGYFAVSKILPTSIGNDTLIEYQLGAITQHSIGGYIVDGVWDKDHYVVKKFDLFEVSTLTHWGAQPETPVISIKEKEKEKIDFYKIYFNTLFKF
jgi:HK97 family phage prohead protease